MTLQGITEDEIANYLVHTPGFFERNAQLLAAIQLTSPHGQRAVSLQERQMEMLRDKIRGLERRIMDMIRHGQENEAIAERLHRWVRTVLLAQDRLSLPEVLLQTLCHEFMVPQAGLRLWSTNSSDLRPEDAQAPWAGPVSEELRGFAATLTQPYCGLNSGLNSGIEAARWLPEAASVSSLALIALHHKGQTCGLMVLGSPDATRYSADMGVDFLAQVGDTASAAFSRLYV